jgi:hypothetical protein
MEGKIEDGRRIASHALAMAVKRVTNDNTIRYVLVSLKVAIVGIFIGFLLHLVLFGMLSYEYLTPEHYKEFAPYVTAGMAGAIGAVLSVTTHLRAFELRPCNESRMTYFMGGVRVLVGLISGMILLLLGDTLFMDTIVKVGPKVDSGGINWETATLLGVLGGFAERLIPSLLRRTVDTVDPTDGTPVQAARHEQLDESRSDFRSQYRRRKSNRGEEREINGLGHVSSGHESV